MHYRFMGIDVDVPFKIVLRNDLGVLHSIDAKQLAIDIHAGKTEVDLIKSDGKTVWANGWDLLKESPIYSGTNKRNDGIVTAFGYMCKGGREYVMCVNIANEILYIPIDMYNKIKMSYGQTIVLGNEYFASYTRFRVDCRWHSVVDKKIIKEKLWHYDSNGKYCGCFDERKDLVLLNRIIGKDSKIVGFRVLTRELKVINIRYWDMLSHLFQNAEICDISGGWIDIEHYGQHLLLKNRDIITDLEFMSVNGQRPYEMCTDCNFGTGRNTDVYKVYRYQNAKYFGGMLPFNVRITWNNRLSRCAGYCTNHDRDISLSPHYADRFPDDIPSVLLHEMIHLWERNHTAGFNNQLERIRELGGDVHRFSKGRAKEKKGKKYTVRCIGCGNIHKRDRLINDHSRCAACGYDEFSYMINERPDLGWMLKEDILDLRSLT